MAKGRSKLGSNKPLTKNQARKAQRGTEQAERLRSVTKWAEEWEERKRNPQQTKTTEKRTRHIDMSRSAKKRRSRALVRLTEQLELNQKVLSTKGIIKIPYEIYSKLMEETATPEIILPLNHGDVERINKEIATLKSRGATVPKPVVVL